MLDPDLRETGATPVLVYPPDLEVVSSVLWDDHGHHEHTRLLYPAILHNLSMIILFGAVQHRPCTRATDDKAALTKLSY